MGPDTATAAGRALTLLNSPDLRQPPTTGPNSRHATATTAAAPLNIGLVDYLTRTVGEVTAHVRDIAPDAGPRPEDMGQLYHWYVDQTQDAEPAEQDYRDFLMERQYLESCIIAGHFNVVRGHPCPACGCLGVFWDSEGNRALCSNRRCRTPDGLTRSWTLARLAAQKVQQTENWRMSAT